MAVSDHQRMEILESLATKVSRVQRWFEFLSTYTKKLVYRPGQLNGNANLMSRLLLLVAEGATCEKLRLTHPWDVDVYFMGASGLQPHLGTRRDFNQGGLECRTAGRRGVSLSGLDCRTDEIMRWARLRSSTG